MVGPSDIPKESAMTTVVFRLKKKLGKARVRRWKHGAHVTAVSPSVGVLYLDCLPWCGRLSLSPVGLGAGCRAGPLLLLLLLALLLQRRLQRHFARNLWAAAMQWVSCGLRRSCVPGQPRCAPCNLVPAEPAAACRPTSSASADTCSLLPFSATTHACEGLM